jgi:hypothetical protein
MNCTQWYKLQLFLLLNFTINSIITYITPHQVAWNCRGVPTWLGSIGMGLYNINIEIITVLVKQNYQKLL